MTDNELRMARRITSILEEDISNDDKSIQILKEVKNFYIPDIKDIAYEVASLCTLSMIAAAKEIDIDDIIEKYEDSL